MVQGDAYSIEVEITNEGQTLSPPAVSLVEIALLNLVKTYPGDVTFSDGKFHFPLTQTETFGLPTVCPMQVRVKFPSGDVIGSEMQQIDVKRALSRAVICWLRSHLTSAGKRQPFPSGRRRPSASASMFRSVRSAASRMTAHIP